MSNEGSIKNQPNQEIPLTNQDERRIRDKWLKWARKQCDGKIKEFAACEKEHPVLVFMKCKQEWKNMNACTRQYTTEEHHERFRQQYRAKTAEMLKNRTHNQDLQGKED